MLHFRRSKNLPKSFYIVCGTSVLALLVTLFTPKLFPFTLVRLLFVAPFIFFAAGFTLLRLLSVDAFLTLNELFLLSIWLGLSILRIVSFAYPVWMDESTVMLLMVLLVVTMAAVSTIRNKSEVKTRHKKNEVFSLGLMGFAGLVGLIFPLLHVLKSPLFFGADTWWLWEEMTKILGGENLASPFNPLVLVCSLLGISPFEFVRFGGPFMSALISMSIFALARRGGLSKFSAIIASFILATTPRIVYRFNMTLMENLALCLFVMVFLLIEIAESQGLQYKKIGIPLGLIVGSLITFHISSIYMLIIFGFLFMAKAILRNWQDFTWLAIGIVIAIVTSSLFPQYTIPKIYGLLFLYGGQPDPTATQMEYPPASFDYILTELSPFHFLLTLMGLSIMIWSWKRYRNTLFWLIPHLSFFVCMTQASGFGLFWPGWRFVVYLPLGTSLLASVPFHFIQDIFRKSYLDTVPQSLRASKRFSRVLKKHWKDAITIAILLPTILPVVYLNSVLAYDKNGWAGWDEQDIQSIEWFKLYQQSHPGVIMGSYWFLSFSAREYNILNEQNTTIVQEVLNASSSSERVSMLKDLYGEEYSFVYFYVTSWEKKIYYEEYMDFYNHLSVMPVVLQNEKTTISKLYIGNYPRLTEDWAENNSEEYSGLVLSDSIEYKQEGNHSLHINTGSGSQWLRYNFYETQDIEVNYTEWNILHFYLYNNATEKNVFVRLYDSNDRPSERAIIRMEHGWNEYYIYPQKFELDETKTTRVREIEWSFSWYDNSPIDLWLDGLYFCKEA